MDENSIVKCQCGSMMFTEVVSFAKISAVASQNGKAGLAPIGGTYICMNCGVDISETEAVKELKEPKSSLVI